MFDIYVFIIIHNFHAFRYGLFQSTSAIIDLFLVVENILDA